jgi:hypothetical protein
MLCYIINIIKINKEGKLIKDYSKINSMWDVLVNDIDEVADKTRFTQLEKDFVVEFMANTLHGLTLNNVESRAEGDGFIRMADALEVMDNLQMLYGKHEEHDGDWQKGETVAKWTFTLAEARDALCSYDTEYRDCITEQFEEACFDKWRGELMNKQVNEQVEEWLTLACRIFES